jgi:hypothetical protein
MSASADSSAGRLAWMSVMTATRFTGSEQTSVE